MILGRPSAGRDLRSTDIAEAVYFTRIRHSLTDLSQIWTLKIKAVLEQKIFTKIRHTCLKFGLSKYKHYQSSNFSQNLDTFVSNLDFQSLSITKAAIFHKIQTLVSNLDFQSLRSTGVVSFTKFRHTCLKFGLSKCKKYWSSIFHKIQTQVTQIWTFKILSNTKAAIFHKIQTHLSQIWTFKV